MASPLRGREGQSIIVIAPTDGSPAGHALVSEPSTKCWSYLEASGDIVRRKLTQEVSSCVFL